MAVIEGNERYQTTTTRRCCTICDPLSSSPPLMRSSVLRQARARGQRGNRRHSDTPLTSFPGLGTISWWPAGCFRFSFTNRAMVAAGEQSKEATRRVAESAQGGGLVP